MQENKTKEPENECTEVLDVPQYNHCLLSYKSSETLFITCLLAPLCLVILINLCITVQVGVRVYVLSKKTLQLHSGRTQEQSGKHDLHAVVSGLRAVALLFPILGLPWVFAMLVGKFGVVVVVVSGFWVNFLNFGEY